MHPTRPLLLGLTTLIAPMLLGIHAFVEVMPDIDDSPRDSAALIAGGVLLAGLVVTRFMLVIRRASGRADLIQARYQTLVEQVPAVVVLLKLTADGSDPPPVYVSPQAETMIGIRPSDWIADPTSFVARIHRDDVEMLRRRLMADNPGGPAMNPQFRVLRPDGVEIWMRDVSGVVVYEDGAAYQHSMLVDVTEAKRGEAEQERMEAELRLSQKLEAVGQLAAGIAHEINTPTQFVGDTIRFLKDAFDDLLVLIDAYEALAAAAAAGTVTPELLERVRVAEERADLEYLRERVPGAFVRGADGISRVARIVRAMRDFAHPPTLEKAPVDVVAALQDTLIMTAQRLQVHRRGRDRLRATLPEIVATAASSTRSS